MSDNDLDEQGDDLDKQGNGGGRAKACPVCGAENEPEASVCSGCSFTFEEGESSPGTNNSADMECPSCGAVISKGDTTCIVCGEVLESVAEPEAEPMPEIAEEEVTIVCPTCSAELPEGTTGCFICGADISTVPEEALPGEEAPTGEGWDLGVVGGEEPEEGEEKPEVLEEDLETLSVEEAPEPEEAEPIEGEEAEEEPEEEPAEEYELGINEFLCPSCSKPVTIGSSRCSNCWADLPDMTRCPKCENVIPMESESCPDCFARLEMGVLVEEPPEAEEEFIPEEPEEALMPEEEAEEYIEEITEVYGVECPFCNAVINAGEDICPECGMPLIEGEMREEPALDEEGMRKPERDWYRITAFALVVILLASAMTPFILPLPHVDRDQIRIDGSFSDWEPIAHHNDTLEGLNPNIDIIDYRLISDVFNVYFYIQVQGQMFGDADGDTARIFIDLDQDESTGYRIMGIGADYQLRVFGHAGQVESSSCLRFDDTRAHNDLNGFESFCPSVPHTSETTEDDDKFEVRVALEDIGMNIAQPINVVYYLGNADREHDFSDTPITNVGSLLFVRQSSVVAATGLVSLAQPQALALDLLLVGDDIDINGISITGCTVSNIPGTMTDGESANVAANVNMAVLSAGDFVNVEASPSDFDAGDASVVVTGYGAYAYAYSAPNLIQIDGAFADWNGKGLAIADPADDELAKDLISPIDEPGLDLVEQNTAVENNALNIMVSVTGEMFAGMWVPEMEERYVDTPSQTRSETPEQQDPIFTEPPVTRSTRQTAIQRPAVKQVKTGEGEIRVFIDIDNDLSTGYLIGDIGADRLVQVFGQEGKVTRTAFSTFGGTDQNMQDWTLDTTVAPNGASSGSGVELSVPMTAFGASTSDNATAVIQVLDWNLNGDVSDISTWDIFESGTRGTRSLDPPSCIKGAVTTDGSIREPGATVIARNIDNDKRITFITHQDVEPWAINYAVYLQGSDNDPVNVYATNGTHWGLDQTIYPDGTGVSFCDVTLANEIPDTVPENLQLLNLAPVNGSRGIELTWVQNDPVDDIRVWRTARTTSEFGTIGRGRYYGPNNSISHVATLSGSANSFIDLDLPGPWGPIANTTNWYFLESNVTYDYNYTEEIGIVVDFWPLEITHTNVTEWYGTPIPITANFTDGYGVQSATLYYRKSGAASWSTRPMSLISGNTKGGDWRTYMPVEMSGETIQYEYYINATDGTFNTLFGGPGDPIILNAGAPPNDPYPIYGYVYWGNPADRTPVGAGVDVYVSWVNTSGIVNTTYFQTIATSQYSVDILDYDSNTTIWANGTINGIWGYNTTMVILPSEGGEWVDIYLETPELNITKIAPANANAGDIIMYTIVVSNNGNSTAYNVNVTETYDPWVTFLNATPAPTFGNNVWIIPSMLPNTTFTIFINVTVNVSTPMGTWVDNFVNATWTNSTNMTWGVVNATALTYIGAAIINITKWAPEFANTGELITYWLNYSNTGTDWANNVVITETYPPGVTFISSIPDPDVGNNVWIIGLLGPGENGGIEITVQVNLNATGILVNMAIINGTGLSGLAQLEGAVDWGNTTIIDPFIVITKEAPAFANTGQTITYWINYTNNGTDTAYNVVITENYPPGVTFVSAFPSPDVGNNVWLIGDLDPGEGGTIMINVTINATASGTLTNWVYLDYADGNTEVQPQVWDWANTTIIDPWMTITKTAPATANPGEVIMYTITYQNIGDDIAYNVWINETYPPGVTYLDSSIPPTVGDYAWFIGNVLPGTGGTIFINVTIGAGANGTLTNWVFLEYQDNAGQFIGPISAWAITDILNPQMEIIKVGPASANTGELITYWIFYNNTGTDTAYNVTITENYPPDVTFISAIPPPDIGNNIWLVGDVPAGGGGSIEITVQVNLTATLPQWNNVMLDYNNSAWAMPQLNASVVTIIDDPLMVISKEAPPTANPGDIITYWINYSNVGSDWAYNVVITETYPPWVIFISAIPPPDVGNDTWLIGDVPPGGWGSIEITVQINPSTPNGTLTNWVNLDYEDAVGEVQPTVWAWANTTVLIILPDMAIWKTGPDNATAGETIMYTITYFNNGTATATNVTITETYPAGSTFVNANPPPDIGDNVWLIGDVLPDTGGVIFINITLDANATGLLVNNVTLEYNNTLNQTMPAVNATWVTYISGPYMQITKTAPPFANSGETIMYTIFYENIGNDTAYNVVITEIYPPGVTFVDANPPPDVGDNVWLIGDVLAGANGTIFINVTIDANATGSLFNEVYLDYENVAGIALPTEWADATTIIIDPFMTIIKTGPDEANPGEVIMYTITYQNTGTADAYNVTITETYDPWVTFLNSNPPPDVGDNVWIFPVVPAGTGGVIFINVTIDVNANGTITNTVILQYEDQAGEAQDPVSIIWETLLINPYLVITKEAPPTASPGQIITYLITIENWGDDWAYNVTITETYPPGITFISALPPPDIGNNVWIIPFLAPGASTSIEITVQVNITVPPGTILNNLVVAGYNNSAGVSQNLTNATIGTLIIDSEVIITKWAPPFANTGELITYWLNYTNVGADWAYNVTITETYPVGVTFISAIPPPDIGDDTWLIGNLAPGANGSIEITVQVNLGLPIGTPLLNNVTVDYENLAGLPYQDWDTALTIVIDPIMTINKTGPPTATPGEVIMYTITYFNAGNDTAYNVVITENYPPEVTFLNANPPPDVPTDNVWTIGTVPPGTGGTIFINVTVSPTANGTIFNFVWLEFENNVQPMPIEGTTLPTLIEGPFIIISKTAPATASETQNITYTIQITNVGSAPAYNVVITETYPADVTFVSSIPIPDNPGTGNDTWTVGTLNPGESFSITITVNVNVNATLLINNVTVDYENLAGLPYQNWAEVTTLVSGPWLTVEKSAPATANTGEIIIYTIWVNNTGNAPAYNVNVTETYPAGTTYIGGTAPTFGNNVWIFPIIDVGGVETITIVLSIDLNATGTLMNTVMVNYENNVSMPWPTVWAFANTTIIDPELTVTKDAPPFANTGETITYTIWVNNTGTDTAYDVWLNETYPVGVTFIGAVPPPTVGNNAWYLGDLAPGTSITITITLLVNATGGWLNNTAYADYHSNVRQLPTVWANASTQVINPLMTIEKSAPATANSGEIITYWIWYNNTGNDWAYNVIITETYPLGVTFISSIPPPDVGNNIWLIGDVAQGTGSSIEITVQVEDWASGWLNNSVTLEFENGAGIPQLIINATAGTLITDPLMVITKTAPEFASINEIIMYTITYYNNGTGDAHNVVITEIYPPGVTFFNANPWPNIGDNVWLIGTVPAGTGGTIFINVTIGPTAPNTMTNWVYLDYENSVGPMLQVDDFAQTEIIYPVLEITKTAPPFANTGENITYTIMVENIGNANATNVVVTESYPAGVIFISATPPPDIGNNVWLIPLMNPGDVVWINITVQVNATSGTLDNYVQVDYENDFGFAYDYVFDVAQTLVINPEMVITKEAPASANTGEMITYYINYSNIGTDWAYNVTITETYPAGVIFISALPPPDIGNNIWLIGDVAPGANGSIEITVLVDLLGYWVNNVTLEFNNTAGLVQLPVNTTAGTLVGDPSMELIKSAPETAVTGQTIMYTIQYWNNGTADAVNVVITETYPPWVTFVNATPPPDIGNNVWLIGTVPAGTGGIIFINVTIDANATGVLTNNVTLEWEDEAGQIRPTLWAEAVTVISGPYVEISKTAPPLANPGETIMYIITYQNIGNETAYNVWINETYPAGVTFVDANPPPTVGDNAWFIGDLVPGASGVIYINVTIDLNATGNLTNTVIATYENMAGELMPINIGVAETVINEPILNITKTAPPTASPGQTITYWINYTNTGTDWAYNVTITETYPAGVTFVSSIPPPSISNNIWDGSTVPQLAALAPGASGSIQITVLIDLSATGSLLNLVIITYNNSAGMEMDPESATAVTIVMNPEITIIKSAPAFAVPGEFINYTITYTNVGLVWAYNVIIFETYPVGVTFISAIPPPDIGNNGWLIGDLAPGANGSIQITVQVNIGVSGDLVNNVSADYENAVGIQMPTEYAEAITTVSIPELTVTKIAPPFANTGEQITYTIMVENTGLVAIDNVVVTETYPAGVTFVSALPPPDVGNNIWLLGMMNPGDIVWINITVQVNLDAFGTLVNTVVVNYTDMIGQPYPSEIDIALTDVVDPVMVITKEGPATANPGQTITYWINYTNNGNDWAYSVIITETYPAGVTFIAAAPPPDIGNNIWLIGAVAPGMGGSIQITVSIDLTASGTLVNWVYLDYENSVMPMLQVSDSLETLIIEPDMEITKVGPATANTGQLITYWIFYNNTGTDWAYDVVITENYPVGVTFISAIPPPGISDNIWLIGDVAPGGGGMIQINVQVNDDAVGTLINWVYLDYNSTAIVMPQESDFWETQVIDPLLQITKWAPAFAVPGEVFTYSLTITNIGNDAAYEVYVYESYPPGINFISAIPLPFLGNNIWYFPIITAGSTVIIDITVQVDEAATGSLVNTATVNYTDAVGEFQPEVVVNATTIIIGPNMEITKDAPPAANATDVITYWINYTNTGTDWAYNVVITETYPPGVIFISAIPAPNIGNNIWLIPPVAPGGSGSIEITVQILGGFYGVLENYVQLDYENSATTQYPFVWDTAITVVGDTPYVEIWKTAPPTANSGEVITYTITYQNVGLVPAFNVVITETYPFGVSFIASVPPPDVGNNVWLIGLLAPGAIGWINITVLVTGSVYGVLTNIVVVDYQNTSGVNYTGIAEADTLVIDPLMQVIKTAPPVANVLDIIMYTITYQNIGNDTAYNVVITENYPAGVAFLNATPTPDIGNNIWLIGDLAPLEGGVIFINVTILAAGIWVNQVDVDYQNTSGFAQPTVTDYAITVVEPGTPYVVIDKWAQPFANPGGYIMIVINYTNLGDAIANNVVITETYPPFTTYFNATPFPDLPPDNQWTLPGPLNPGQSGTIFVNVSVNIAATGTLMNQVVVTYTGGSDAAFDNTTIVNPSMYIVKGAPAFCETPDIIQYTIEYFNVGTDTAYDVNITENYPPGVTYFSATPLPTFGDNVWIIDFVPAGGSGTITITVQVAPLLPLGTVLNNTVWMNYTNGANVTPFMEMDWAITIITDVVMTLSKTAPPTADPNSTIIYTITYFNEGPGWAFDVWIEEFYPPWVTYVTANPLPTVVPNLWSLGNIAPGFGATIDITVTIDINATGVLENRAMMRFNDTAANTHWLNATAITVVTGPYMILSKSAPILASPGDFIMYTITYQNIGPGIATNVTIVETYPFGVTFVSAVPMPSSGDNIWNIGAVAPGEIGTIVIVVQISAMAFDTLTNWVYLNYQNLSGGQMPTLWANAMTLVAGPSMVIQKEGPSWANPGQTVTYWLNYTNVGLGMAKNVIIEDPIPAGLAYVSSNPPGVNLAGIITWFIGNVPGGASGSISITFTVLVAPPPVVVVNWVYLNYTDSSGYPLPMRSDFWITLIVNPQIQITKEAPATANSGQLITYWINYTNVGDDWAYNVVIIETYPLLEVMFISAIPPPSIGDNIWDSSTIPQLAAMAPGASGSIQITVQILPGVANNTTATNLVDLTYDNNAGAMPPVWATADTLVLDPLLTVEKDALDFANSGQTMTYTLWINNTGGAPAYNIVVMETYPTGITFLSSVPIPDFGNNVWYIPFLDVGDSVTITITVMVNTNVTSGTNLVNNVTVDYEDAIGELQETIYDEVSTLVLDPLLTVVKTAPATANTGETIMYTITITNDGDATAFNINVTEQYSPEVSFVNAFPPPTFGNDVWIIPSLAPGSSYIIWINVTIDTTYDATNWVFVNYEDEALEPQEEVYDSAFTQVVNPYMQVIKTTMNATACAGGYIIYNITYENLGTDNATNVSIVEIYPAGVTFILASPAPTFGNNVWNFTDIPPGGIGWILIIVQVDATVALGDMLNNTVTLTYLNQAGILMPETSDFAFTRVIGPVITLQKTAPATALVGGIFNYTITFWNNGTDWAYNVVIQDAIPIGLSVLSITPPPTAIVLGVYEWTIGTLAPGATGSIVIMVLALQTATDPTINNATLEYENAAGLLLPSLYAVVSTNITGFILDRPPEIVTVPPPFVYAGENVTIWATVTDNETGIDTVIIYYTDIFGVQYYAVMIAILVDTEGNGMYNFVVPAQVYKGIITYYIWANDTMGLTNRTGLYDIPVRLPPYFVWGQVVSSEGTPVPSAIVQVTDTDTNETVIALTDGSGHYILDLATLYSGYMDGEDLEVFATDGSYYGYNYSTIDISVYSDDTMNWPNRRVDIVLSEIPEFTMILAPIIGILILFVLLRRTRRDEEHEFQR